VDHTAIQVKLYRGRLVAPPIGRDPPRFLRILCPKRESV